MVCFSQLARGLSAARCLSAAATAASNWPEAGGYGARPTRFGLGGLKSIRKGAFFAIGLAALTASVLPATAADVGEVREPADYRMTDYRSPVPATVKGGRVVDGAEAEKLWSQTGEPRAVFIDVFPQAPKPPNLPEGTVWRSPMRTSIEGAYWLPNVGYGVLSPPIEAYFREGLERLTQGDKSRAVVFFCLRNCWMSWNSAKRAAEWGYSNVIWFPDGLDAWEEFDLATTKLEPEAGW